ncbi:MAG: hypothetical protein FWC26_09755 [Fibromonadales bacterium]|nr:hypothetical protein [Fibromonadales bacterium]
MAKLAIILFMLLLLGCEEEQQQQECDAICDIYKTNFENSTTSIVYRNDYSPRESKYVSVTKTETGAIAKYKPWGYPRMDPLEAELSIEEWQDFIRALYKCRINEWKRYKSTSSTSLEIYSSDKDKPYVKIPIIGEEEHSVYEGFYKILYDMEAKVEERAGGKHKQSM